MTIVITISSWLSEYSFSHLCPCGVITLFSQIKGNSCKSGLTFHFLVKYFTIWGSGLYILSISIPLALSPSGGKPCWQNMFLKAARKVTGIIRNLNDSGRQTIQSARSINISSLSMKKAADEGIILTDQKLEPLRMSKSSSSPGVRYATRPRISCPSWRSGTPNGIVS